MKEPEFPENRRGPEHEEQGRAREDNCSRYGSDSLPAEQGGSQDLYRSFFEQSPEGMMCVGRNGIIIEANQAFCDLFGFRQADVVGKEIEAFYAYSGDRERFEQELSDYGCVKNFEWRARTGHGMEHSFLVSASVHCDRDGNVAGYRSIVHDVTEQKKVLETLLHSDRIKALGEVAAAAAYNFRNLLQIMVGGTRLAMSNLESGNLSEVKTNLEQVLANLRSAGETARLLSHFSGVKRDKAVPIGRVFDLSRTVEKAVEICVPWIEADPDRSGVNLSLKAQLQTGCLIKGVETELLEVVVNLIWNAAEALRDGGSITVSTSRERNKVVLRVQDDGIGIPREHLPKVFQPFWTTKGLEGSGLGLASSYGIVCRHGGDITIESQEDQGTTVSVILPVPDKTPTLVSPYRGGPVRDPSYRILVVDDLEPLLRILKHGLAKRGQQVLTASSGEEALRLFQHNEFDAVICDLAMPNMSGWQVGARIIELCVAKGIPKTPFILLTGWGGQVDQPERIAQSGVDAVVEKPMDVPRLLEVVRDLVFQNRQICH